MTTEDALADALNRYVQNDCCECPCNRAATNDWEDSCACAAAPCDYCVGMAALLWAASTPECVYIGHGEGGRHIAALLNKWRTEARP